MILLKLTLCIADADFQAFVYYVDRMGLKIKFHSKFDLLFAVLQ